MTVVTPKTDDQITKDKEAVARMVGAKSAMEAAQRRIEALEACLRQCESDLAKWQKDFGDKIAASEYVDGAHKFTPVFTQFQNARNRIAKVQL
jgi:hypothetical protein